MFRGSILFLTFIVSLKQYVAGNPIMNTEYLYKYDGSEDSELRLHIVPAVWSDAALRCQLQGAVLATPTTNAMLTAMLNAMKAHNIDYSGVLIGVTDRLSKGEFQSLDGEDLVDSLDWAIDEPDNMDDDEHCMGLTNDGTLADFRCTRLLPYFCRKIIKNSPSTEIPTTDKPTIEELPPMIGGDSDIYDDNVNDSDIYKYDEHDDNDENPEKQPPVPSYPQCRGKAAVYEYEPRTGSCYKFHRDPLAWLPALAKCHDEGGHLAIVNSGVESTVLKELFKQNPRRLIPNRSHEPNYASIGFRKWDDDKWATIHGETPEEAGFDTWSPGEPNSFMGAENCGSIYRDGLLNDSSCTLEFPFICEINL